MSSIKERIYLTNQVLKAIKKSLPKNCTYLSLFKRSNGETCIRAVVNRVDHLYSVPQDFNLTEASFERIHSLITEACNKE